GKNILSQPIIPVKDIAGNWASGKAPRLGNNTNPVKEAARGPDNRNRNTRIFGNAFARVDLLDGLWTNSSLGINAGEGSSRGYTPIRPEDSEPSLVNSINESNNYFTSWTVTNTLNLQRTLAEEHNFTLMGG